MPLSEHRAPTLHAAGHPALAAAAAIAALGRPHSGWRGPGLWDPWRRAPPPVGHRPLRRPAGRARGEKIAWPQYQHAQNACLIMQSVVVCYTIICTTRNRLLVEVLNWPMAFCRLTRRPRAGRGGSSSARAPSAASTAGWTMTPAASWLSNRSALRDSSDSKNMQCLWWCDAAAWRRTSASALMCANDALRHWVAGAGATGGGSQGQGGGAPQRSGGGHQCAAPPEAPQHRAVPGAQPRPPDSTVFDEAGGCSMRGFGCQCRQ